MAKILIVDDDLGCRNALRAMLESQHHEVYEVRNGYDAVQAYADVKPALVLLDVLMPGKDGIEIIMELRGQRHRAPVIVMSSGGSIDMESIFSSLKMMGAFGSLWKPFDLEALTKMVDAALVHGSGSSHHHGAVPGGLNHTL